MFPDWLRLPMVVLATAATVIASQAVITGAYSLSRQAVQLGLLPRLEFRHTSESQFGQIYVPRVNAFLLVSVLLRRRPLPLLRRSRRRLRHRRHRHDGGDDDARLHRGLAGVEVERALARLRWCCRSSSSMSTFLAANLLKILHGGWFPLLLGIALMIGHADLAARQPHPLREDPPP